MINLEEELRAAQRLASDPRCAAAFDLPADLAGAGYVKLAGDLYQPAADGEPAVIIAAESGGELVDLVAVRLSDRTIATRLGGAALLGEDAVEAARIHDHTLLIYRDPLHWLGAGCLGAAILDWGAVRWTLADVPRIKCATPHLEARIRHAFLQPVHLPALSSAEVHYAA